MWCTGENAGLRPISGGREKVGADRRGVVLFFMFWTSELFAGEKQKFHGMYCLWRGDVAVFRITSSCVKVGGRRRTR